MKQIIKIVSVGLSLVTLPALAQWGSMPFGSSGSNMMPWSGSQAPVYQAPQSQPFGGMMPWGSSAPRYQAPQSNGFANMMPWGGSQAPVYQAPQSQPFGGMMPWGNSAPRYQAPQSNGFGNMMPWGGSQPSYRQPQSNFMMPGMESGIRSMMQPGKIMAQEATPGMYMKPTWQ